MQSTRPLSTVPDDELLRLLATLLEASRHTESDLVAHIGEVDARRLYLREATASMFRYCTERLHLSPAEAYLRIAAARASREHPLILDMLADGRLHLTGVALLAPHLTRDNRDVLLCRATHKTKREIEELVAELSPRPDVRAMIRKLPERPTGGSRDPALRSPGAGPVAPSLPVQQQPDSGTSSRQPLELRPDVVVSVRSDGEVASERHATEAGGAPRSVQQHSPSESRTVVDHRSTGRTAAPIVEPLSPARYRVQFTASAELCDKIERLKALMHSSVPDGDLAVIMDAAVTEKLERLEARRFGRSKAPGKALSPTHTAPSSRHVPAAVRRAVHERDQGRCRYADEHGRRCKARVGLEFHHRHPFGLGGNHSPTNVSELCRGHNQYLARIDFGRTALGKDQHAGARPDPRLRL